MHVASERGHLAVAEHKLEEREDALRRSGVGGEGADNLHRQRPRRDVEGVVLVPQQHALGEGRDIVVVEGSALALDKVPAVMRHHARPSLRQPRAWAHTTQCVVLP